MKPKRWRLGPGRAEGSEGGVAARVDPNGSGEARRLKQRSGQGAFVLEIRMMPGVLRLAVFGFDAHPVARDFGQGREDRHRSVLAGASRKPPCMNWR